MDQPPPAHRPRRWNGRRWKCLPPDVQIDMPVETQSTAIPGHDQQACFGTAAAGPDPPGRPRSRWSRQELRRPDDYYPSASGAPR